MIVFSILIALMLNEVLNNWMESRQTKQKRKEKYIAVSKPIRFGIQTKAIFITPVMY
jgi:hypothetical protein